MDSKLKYLILFIFGFVIFIIAMKVMFKTPKDYIESTFKIMEFKGILIEKYREPANHDMRFIKVKTSTDTIVLDTPCNFEFWNFVHVQDSIIKEKESTLIIVKRISEIYKFDMQCD